MSGGARLSGGEFGITFIGGFYDMIMWSSDGVGHVSGKVGIWRAVRHLEMFVLAFRA
jgi:hypothetical protein